MSIWARVNKFLSSVSTDAFSGVVEAVRTVFEGQPEVRKQVGFSIAMIALSAKMAKADGVVTVDEVKAFQQLFAIPAREQQNVARLYNLAKQDVAGYHAYVKQVKNLFPDNDVIYQDVMDGLFHIAKADGLIHENEMLFMDDVAGIFDLSDHDYSRMKMRHVDNENADPYLILDADPHWDYEKLKKHYINLVRENHPDKLIAHGVPEEFVAIANNRLSSINNAWDIIDAERQPQAVENA
ncbi:MAG: DnaJ family molecular chaperone [Hyphomicrobiales bacterium]|nr:DnaJ family molecular chaperone [Hyphomicrobiales bacterium]